MSRLSVGFLMDPLEGILPGHDTTFALMLEAQRRGHEVVAFEQRQLSFQCGVRARARSVEVTRAAGPHFRVVSEGLRPLDGLDAIFLRKDPPVDVEFLHATQLLELAKRPLLLNAPRGLRSANEKLFALSFPSLTPETLVAREKGELLAFIRDFGGAVLKPLDGSGGKAVVRVTADDQNANAIIELLTSCGEQSIVAQRFIPESAEGDKRILLLDGEPLGAVLRVAQPGDLRCNLAAGGKAVRTTLTARDREICAALAPALRERGLAFTGIDVIGGFLIEVNVTSPTGLVEIDALEGTNLAARVLEHVEARVGG